MKLRLLEFVSVGGILLVFTVTGYAQTSNGSSSSSTGAPSPEPSPAPPTVETVKKEEPKPSDREKALLDRIDQLEKRLAEVETLVKRPAAETVATESTKTSMSTEPVRSGTSSTDASLNSPEERQTLAQPQKPKKEEPFAFADWSWLT